MKHLVMAEPRIDARFLDGVVAAAKRDRRVIRSLSRLPRKIKRRLLGRGPAAAREAARDLMSTYFGAEKPEEIKL